MLSHPTQYYSPWFRWLKAHSGLELRVFYLWDFGIHPQEDPQFGRAIKWDVDLVTGYDSEFVPNTARHPGAEHFFGFRNPGLLGRMSEWGPDAVLLFGYKWASHLQVIAWARLRGVPLVFRGDSTLIGRTNVPLSMRLSLKLLFRQMSAFTYVGSANRDYFAAFGVPERKLFFAPHSVDSELFDPADPVNRERASMLRSELGIGRSTRVLLFAGKLSPGKGPAELLEAFIRLNPTNAALVFVGDGSERVRLESIAREGLTARDGPIVRFLPFANQSEMPSRYLLGNIFVLPSESDSWGLAVNEAMLMGLLCVVSDRVGCQRDLVTHGETGWVYEHGKRGALGAALAQALAVLESSDRVAGMSEAAKRRIEGYSYAATTAGLLGAIASLPA